MREMAGQPSSFEDFLSCFICTNEFEENGVHIPRLLLCTHTLCEKCIKEIIDCGTLKCPFDNLVHPALENEKSFSQNKYILNQIKIEKRRQPSKRCEEHGKELTLFCKEPGCQMPICVACLKHHHRIHDFVEIEEAMEALMKDTERVQTRLQAKKKALLNVQEDIKQKTEKCFTTLNKNVDEIKHKVNKHFKEMTEDAANVRDEVKYQIECVVDDINENLMILESIKQDRGRNQNLHNLVEIVKNIHIHYEQDLCGTRAFHFPRYKPSFFSSHVNYSLGNITMEEVVAKFPEVTEHLSRLKLESAPEPERERHLEPLPPFDGRFFLNT